MKNAWISLAVACALVIGVYAYMVQSGVLEVLNPNAADAYYNLLVQGFRAGQLSLKKEVPPGFAQLTDPYDPTANAVYRSARYWLHDLSYYKGRFYLYFGVTPAVMLFWPFVVVTGEYLSHRQAVLIFCSIGFAASVGLLRAVWHRYFADVNVWLVSLCALALGLATGVPVMLPRSSVYEVAISCGYMLTMLSLGAIWCALHEPERRCWWLAAASLAYGLAVGARSSLLFGAIVLLVPVAQAWRERRRIGRLLIAAIGPITFVGMGLMLYNAMRFDSPFEFGQHYQLALVRPIAGQFFHLRYFWFNFRVYFLEPARWSVRFPFVHEIHAPPFPAGYTRIETPFGVLTNIPLVWLAVAVPLAWRDRSRQEVSALRWFVAAAALLFGTSASTLLFYESAVIRYEVDFLPSLLLLAVIGILGLERMLAGQPVGRRVARWGWSLLLVFSVAFNLLASVGHYAEAHNDLGVALGQTGRIEEAIAQHEQALRINPDYAAGHCNLGNALQRTGKIEEAIAQYKQALWINPDFAEAHVNLGVALAQTGRIEDAIAHYEQAVRIRPDYVEAHNNLGVALAQTGRIEDAIAHYKQAVRINPDFAVAHNNLGLALELAGDLDEAIAHYEQALRINPNLVETHFNLGLALEKQSRTPEAIEHYQQALKLRPDYAPVRNALARLQARQ